MGVPDQVEALELYPGDEIFMNIMYDGLGPEFLIDILQTEKRSFLFAHDTTDEYALMSKAAILGAQFITFAGFIPEGGDIVVF